MLSCEVAQWRKVAPFNWHLLCSRASHTQEMNGFTSLIRAWEGFSYPVMSSVSLGDWLIDWQLDILVQKIWQSLCLRAPTQSCLSPSLYCPITYYLISSFLLDAPFFLIEKFPR